VCQFPMQKLIASINLLDDDYNKGEAEAKRKSLA
jgi:hypothetical protein